VSTRAFGPNLRRLRLQRGISLEELTARTNVSVELWEAMERNDFSRWPTGVAARAYVRDYATVIGVDRTETVDEFCRISPHGDRRGYRVLRDTAALLGHDLVWRGDLPALVAKTDRRTSSDTPDEREDRTWWNTNLRRLVAGADLVVVVVVAGGVAVALRLNLWATLAVSALAYHSVSLVFLGCSPAVWAIDAYMSAHRPLDRHRVPSAFRGMDVMAGKPPMPGRRPTD
jgi:transcriptional regulator with XRE-family HTH domain